MPYGRPKPKPPARVPPGAAVTAAEFADIPFGGHAGEWVSGGQAAPASAPPHPLVIEPPPWATQETGPIVALAAPASASAAQPTALEVLTTGELQIKIAPDAEGKSCAVILDAIPPTFVYFR